jgi:hypothetical protein
MDARAPRKRREENETRWQSNACKTTKNEKQRPPLNDRSKRALELRSAQLLAAQPLSMSIYHQCLDHARLATHFRV